MRILYFLDVETVFMNVLGYPMSYLEFAGTLLNLLSVYLVTRNSIWTWPVGNVAVFLFALLFYQIRLYVDVAEQVYFFFAGLYGWWAWAFHRHNAKEREAALEIGTISGAALWGWVFATFSVAALLGFVMARIHTFLPSAFPDPASYPYIDSFTTVLSMIATLLMAHKKVECWYMWIVVDVIGIGLYFAKDVVLVALLYIVFLFLAVRGLLNWRNFMREANGTP